VYLDQDTQLPCFKPQYGSDDVREHIARMKIPVIPTSTQPMSLLLHNLGRTTHDPRLSERVKELFVSSGQQRYAIPVFIIYQVVTNYE
jgi:hypothetical protein